MLKSPGRQADDTWAAHRPAQKIHLLVGWLVYERLQPEYLQSQDGQHMVIQVGTVEAALKLGSCLGPGRRIRVPVLDAVFQSCQDCEAKPEVIAKRKSGDMLRCCKRPKAHWSMDSMAARLDSQALPALVT